MADTFADTATSGPLVLAILAAALAGLVSFLSPCVLPLVPGYLSFITGLTGTDLEKTSTSVRGRVLAGSALFIAGFTVVFTLSTVLVANVGGLMMKHQRPLEIGAGALIIVLGLAFMGLIPGMQREFRINRLPDAGLLGAPIFGAIFALSWTPCIGPTLGSVMALAAATGQTDRAAVLGVAYSLGLGVPFLVFGLGFKRLLGVFKTLRRHGQWVTRIGGGMLVLVGLALVTGAWNRFLIWLLTTVGVGDVLL
ncbi:cytochrome c biogenesis CcdA family protein [Catenuloplanes atrovinosus]|uniref:Cytochrome c-type biogenesis protein n=1 Tax=Catenuloplanes atrovinosus TaxID=137266 RepID=A0AAE3YWL8_9ACTN|nr:cytochrome c biogenesis protein CcdA [Catenuloplanes atrovinosus]MDR7279753.1 cytochrome c-type biogenesis protein [Catenuloplanes atrovinosus]